MDGGFRRYARWAGDVVAAVALVAFEAVALFGVLAVLTFGTYGASWVPLVCVGGLALCTGIIAAAAWSARTWVTAAVQGLVTGGCLVTVIDLWGRA
ncbi:hypothetical protein [Streptomyces shenzhenensis]|uniref:hypothetical protein n=1 Tax=Streptomyces shenzhenensis TaxID=943815 RepID=UPI0015F04697|nr:hypothetical protein [Streptomyces shenzhenensis]